MKCRDVEKLLPLFAGEDLSARQMAAVGSHLAECRHCSGLADDLDRSLAWFYQAPSLPIDDADLARMRASVFDSISEEEAKPALAERLITALAWRPLLATAAMIILLTAGFYGLRLVNEQPPPEKTDTARNAEIRDADDTERNNKRAPVKLTGKSERNKSNQIRRKTTRPHGGLIARTETPSTPPETDPAAPLRIEIQTADPNIRIIWLAHEAPGR